MDTLPHHALPQPGEHVTEATWDAYLAAQASHTFGTERAEIAERRERRADRRSHLCLAAAVLAVLGGAYAVTHHEEHWGLLSYDTRTGWVGVVKDIRGAAMTLGAPVDDYFAKEHVRMREGWQRSTAAPYLAGVSCLLPGEADRKRLDEWYNRDPNAPNQIAARTSGSYRREVAILSDPVADGVLPDGTRHVAVRYAYQDFINDAPAGPPVPDTAYFNVRKDAKAVNACDPAGLVISTYESHRGTAEAGP